MMLSARSAVAGIGLEIDMAAAIRPRSQAESRPADLHRPVMLAEVVELLRDSAEGLLIDGTVGLGGHADALLEAMPDRRLVGIDRDADALAMADLRLSRWNGRYELIRSDYRDLRELSEHHRWGNVGGILVDLGASSLQLETAERGFSFRREGPLDMRMDRKQPRTAADLVNRLEAGELKAIIRDYGEEPKAGRIARTIVKARESSPLLGTTQLAEVVAAAAGSRGPQRIHPATRTFQALRIAVNDEIARLEEFFIAAARLLTPGGVLIALAFHSLEDRQVKRAFHYLASDCQCPPRMPVCGCDKRAEVEILTSRPMLPSEREIGANPRARSARLRAVRHL